MREYRLQHSQDFNLCELYGIKDARVEHHITYNPEKIIRLCRSCHGKVHYKDFPNPLWKQRKSKLSKMFHKKEEYQNELEV